MSVEVVGVMIPVGIVVPGRNKGAEVLVVVGLMRERLEVVVVDGLKMGAPLVVVGLKAVVPLVKVGLKAVAPPVMVGLKAVTVVVGRKAATPIEAGAPGAG
jgi:hypothetical protein